MVNKKAIEKFLNIEHESEKKQDNNEKIVKIEKLYEDKNLITVNDEYFKSDEIESFK